jgi:hypothetical protein
MISLGIGVISSALVSVSYNGMNYVVNFTFNLLRTSGTTLIIDKLNKIKSVDGTSVAILLNLIFSIPVIIAGLSAKPLILGLLFITSLGIIAYGNYKMLQETENTNIHYKDKTDIFSLTTKNNFTTSLITSSFIAGLINNPIISTGLLFIINPLIHWFISYHNIKIDDLKKYLQQNEIYIDGLRYEKEIKAYLKKMIMNSSIKLGLVGAFVFSICSIFTQLFTIAINPIILAVFVSCFINVSFGMKAIIKSNNLNKFIKD